MIKKLKTTYPVSLSEVQAHLKIDASISDDNTYISNNIIKSATRYCENFISKDIALTSNTLEIYDFEDSELRVEEGNLLSLDHIISDTSTLITSYSLIPSADYFEIEFTDHIKSNPLKLEFKTGYDGSINICPDDLKMVVLVECGNQYDNQRDSYIPAGIRKSDIVESMLNPYRKIRYIS